MKYSAPLIAALLLASVWPLTGLAQQNNNAPLSNEELREATIRIEQAILGWQTEKLLKDTLARQQELEDREKDLAGRELNAEKQRTELAQKETALEKTRADFYQSAFEKVTAKRGFGCVLKKIFTLGLAACR